MSNQSIPLSELEQSQSAQFTTMGDRHSGRIIAISQRQQTDPKTGQPKSWNDGNPMMQWIITIEKADGETASLYAKGGKYKVVTGSGESMLAAIATAVKAAGASSADVGGELAVAWTGESEARPGMNAAKLYTAQYRPPVASTSVPVDDLFSPQ